MSKLSEYSPGKLVWAQRGCAKRPAVIVHTKRWPQVRIKLPHDAYVDTAYTTLWPRSLEEPAPDAPKPKPKKVILRKGYEGSRGLLDRPVWCVELKGVIVEQNLTLRNARTNVRFYNKSLNKRMARKRLMPNIEARL